MASERIDSTSDNARRLGLVALVVALVIAAYFFGRQTTGEPEPNMEPLPTQAGVGPTEEINGVPLGFSHDEEGAVAAATAFAIVMTEASGDLEAYRESMNTLAAPVWQEQATELAVNGIDFFHNRYGSGGSATFAPLRYRLTGFSEDSATVDLWGVSTAFGPKHQKIDESWLTGTVELTWVEGDWRVAGQSSQAGPSPELLQTSDGLPMDSLEDFEEYGRAPQP
ncbi:MAG: hypothetical protein QOG54_1403 [Actinomycetota bacterium]|nr:hypothetical protein [Actinomycetota bacterium]